MKVYAMTRIRVKSEHPQSSDAGAVIEYLPLAEPMSKEMMKYYLPVVVDVNIPCEREEWFSGCIKDCPDLDDCDVKQKLGPVFTEGDLFNPPKVERKGRFKIDRGLLVSAKTEAVILSPDKTTEEIDKFLSDALKNFQPNSIIEDTDI